MASIQTLERRIAALEARLADVEGGHSETVYRMQREVIRTRLDIGKLLTQSGLTPSTDDEVDAVLDEQ